MSNVVVALGLTIRIRAKKYQSGGELGWRDPTQLTKFSHDEWKALYLLFWNTYGDQTSKVWDFARVARPTKSRNLLTTWSRSKGKTLYLRFHNTYGHQTWRESDLMWGTQPTKLHDCWITWLRDKWKTLYLHFTILMATKLVRVFI